MKVNLSLDFDDDLRRRINTFMNASASPAKRSVVRVWLTREIAEAIRQLPEAKKGRKRKPILTGIPMPGPADLDRELTKSESLAAALPNAIVGLTGKSVRQLQDEASPDSKCSSCTRPKDEHGKMGYRCPLSKTYSKKTVFVPVN